MRRRGWNGLPPRDEAEARGRIVEAALVCIGRHGPTKTSLSDVATELGVTRQTVYRHFATTEDLLNAAAVSEASAFLDRVTAHLTTSVDAVDTVVEMIAFTLEALPREWFISQSLTQGAVSPVAVGYARALLERVPIDWAQRGYDTGHLDGLAELLLRIVVSFLHSPSDPARSAAELRAVLRMWITPHLSGRPVETTTSTITDAPGRARRPRQRGSSRGRS